MKMTGHRIVTIVVSLTALFASTGLAALQRSKGIYRIPYEKGTTVKVTGDHSTHKPPGRIDMHGFGGSKPYRIVAAADGHIRFIADYFSDQVTDEDRKNGAPCTNNYVWIEHANGEWAKYSHMRKNSTTGAAGLKVGQFVRAGTFLGYEGKVGCASGDHLHFEVGVPRANDPVQTTGGFLKDNDGSKRNRIPRFCAVAGEILVAGETYPKPIAPGKAELTRQKVPASCFECVFDRFSSSGYMPVWIDGYSVGNSTFYNTVWHPARKKWRAYYGLTSDTYQSKFNKARTDGYAPIQVESYLSGDGKVRYAVIFEKESASYMARHGLTYDEHQTVFQRAKNEGLKPISVSVVSNNGKLRYTVLYRKASLGSWRLKSRLTADGFQRAVDDNRAAGRHPVYVNAYMHDGAANFTAIFADKPDQRWRLRFGLTPEDNRSQREKARDEDLLTKVISGYDGAKANHRFATLWQRP